MKVPFALFALLIVNVIPFGSHAQITDTPRDYNALIELASENGKIPVIVDFEIPFQPVNHQQQQALARQRNLIAATASTLRGAMRHVQFENVRTYRNLPHMALVTDSDGIEALLAHRLVRNVSLDELMEPSMDVSNAIIGSPVVWNLGYTGEGTVVAVLDTGVDKTHPHFGNRVVAEACFSSGADTFATSLCPDEINPSFVDGSANDCNMNIRGCGHGTHVAGSVAGSSVNDEKSINGVARDADIIAIQVFSEFDYTDSSKPCGSSATRNCARSYTSDQIAALDWLFDQVLDYNLVAANMSLGGGGYTAACDIVSPGSKNAMDNLKTANVATVVASGNNGFKNAISFPACISTAVSVGSSQTGKSGTTLDAVTVSSNSATFLDLLAPGRFIESTRPGGTYDALSGTSMAAPHVAGAWALYRHAFPNATVDEVLSKLKAQGVMLTDPGNQIIKPRIQIDASILNSGIIYHSRQTGNWDAASTWSTAGCGGSAALQAPGPEDTVEICNGHTVSVATQVTHESSIVVQLNGELRVVSDGVLVAEGLVSSTGGVLVPSGGLFNNLGTSNPVLSLDRELEGFDINDPLVGEGWRYLSSPVPITLKDFLLGIRTQGMTGSSFPDAQPHNINVYRWNEGFDSNEPEVGETAGWVPVSDLNDNAAAGEGFLVYVFLQDEAGDPAPFPKTLSVAGQEFGDKANASQIAAIPLNNNDNGWTLLGNPYATSIRFADLLEITGNGNLHDAVYVWTPNDTGDVNDAGDTVTPDPDEEPPPYSGFPFTSGSWMSYTLTGGTGDLTGGLIAPFQAFFVQTNGEPAPGASLSFSNQAKSSNAGDTQFLFRETASMDLIRVELSGLGMRNAAWMQLSGQGSHEARVPGDAYQLHPHSVDYVLLGTRKEKGGLFDIGHFPVRELQSGRDIPLVAEATRPGHYRLRVTDYIQEHGLALYLNDMEAGISVPLAEGVGYEFRMDGGPIESSRVTSSDAEELQVHSRLDDGDAQSRLDGVVAQTRMDDGDAQSRLDGVAAQTRMGGGAAHSREDGHVPGGFKPPVHPLRHDQLARMGKEQEKGPRFLISINKYGEDPSDAAAEIPEEVALAQNYPNPFNPSTVIRYSIPEEGMVRLTVYDILGRRVGVLVDGQMQAGRHEITWDAGAVSSGIYIYRLEAGGKAITRIMTLLK